LLSEAEVLRKTRVLLASCFALLLNSVNAQMASDDLEIQVKNLVQNGDDVTVLVEVSNKSQKSFDHVEGACAVYNSAGTMIGGARSLMVENLHASELAFDAAQVPVLKSQTATRAACRLNKVHIAQ
jgi:hypothetical protein